MSATSSTRLIDLVDFSFEKPKSGTVNLRLLYTLIRALIVGSKLEDLAVDVDLNVPQDQPGAVPEESFSSSQDEPSGSSDKLGSGSIDLNSGNGSAEIDETTSTSLESSGDREASASQLEAIMNLLRAYLVRLQALEHDVSGLKSGRAETLEMLNETLDQIGLLEGRLCEEQKKVARLSADLDCIGLIVGQHETKFEELDRGLDLLEIQLREVKCSIRCIEKERNQFMDAVRTVTEQINYFATVKADKAEVEAELALRAYAKDLNKYVPFDCFNIIQADVARNVALLHEDIFKLDTWSRSKIYDQDKQNLTKADIVDLETIRKELAKLQFELKRFNQNEASKTKPPGSAAGTVRSKSRPSSCFACGDHAAQDDCGQPIPLLKPLLVPFGKPRDIFTMNRRSAGGSYTRIAPNERLVRSAVSMQIPCKDINKYYEAKQISGRDGSWYQADPDLPEIE
uniref:DUF4795 domain-containing protein n=1 Tax=Culex quinquefasciatus TaxID=7176 RepID=A0A1S4KI89_CULQU